MANEVRIRASVDDKASGQIAKIKDKFDVLGKSGGFKSLVQGVGMGAGVAAFNLLGSAAGAATDFIGQSIAASRDLGESLSKSKVVFGDAAAKVEAFGDTAAASLGMSKQAAVEAAATFGNFLVGVGQSEDAAAGMSTKIVSLAGDLASFNNMDPTEALDKLRAGLAGEAEPLRRVGVFLTAAKVKAKAMEMGLGDAHGELTEGEKILARYQLILDETGTAQGDFARTSESLANKQRTATATLIDAQAELGASFEPMALQVTKWQIDFLEGLGIVGNEFGRLGMQIDEAADQVTFWDGTTTNAMDNVAAATVGMAGQVTAAGHSVRTATGKSGDAFGDLADKADEGTKKVVVSFDDMVDALSNDVSRLIDDVRDPAIQAAELATLKEEDAALRRVINSKTATDEEITDARRRRLSLTKEMDQTRLDLLESGNLSAADAKAWLGALEKKYETATGSAKADIGALIAKIQELQRITAKDIKVVVKSYGLNVPGTGGGRAAGGPVDSNKVYMVGEKGPELFVSKDAGNIIPNDKLGGVGPMKMGAGGMNVAFHFHGMAYPPSPAQQREMAQNLGPAVRDYLARRG